MKFNPDCVRDTLLYLEENLGYTDENKSSITHNTIGIRTLARALRTEKGYNEKEVYDAAEQLKQIGYIQANVNKINSYTYNMFDIYNITYSGHYFLEMIKPEKLWEVIKKKGKESAKGLTLDVLAYIATRTIKEVANNPQILKAFINIIKNIPI